LADAIKAISVPVVEVHISNVAKREKLRRESFISAAVIGTITGFGLKSYRLALDFFCIH
jgi:3-dehydroquinate dehydratase-2